MKIEDIKKLITTLSFVEDANTNIWSKAYKDINCEIKLDFNNKEILYPQDKGFKVNDKTTCNFSQEENFVVFECIDRLLNKGYRPEHLELEKRWNLGHDSKGGKADICVYNEDGQSVLAIIECKTFGSEYNKELSNLKNDGGQLFSYWQQERSAKWLVLYASSLSEDSIVYVTESINCTDDANIIELAKKNTSTKIYNNAHTVTELFETWKETYEKSLHGDIIFDDETVSYKIGIRPLKKKDLVDFSTNDKIVNKFEEILRHNNVSDKENAFNRLIALFICKLVDEINKRENDIVEFQYKQGTDTYESLQDRLQKLHQQGMAEFMKEDIYYVPDDYAEKLISTHTGQKRQQLISELKNTLRILKFYTNNDFAFKDVHNEELFYQNGKVLVEVVKLFERYRIIESQSLQLLGDMFEQLLNKGFKQNEGQFFTPTPITRFIWDSLPLKDKIIDNDKIIFPKIIDYACGAGHFLTEGYKAINDIVTEENHNENWVEKNLYGIEKDYRLARVSKISLFMHGAGEGNIIFGDGLENYSEKNINNNEFDILVANPPYSVSAFKPHLELKNNDFELLKFISVDGSEIETLFVERISQLLKPTAIAAIVLPSSILNKENNSFVGARELLLKNFNIRAIVNLGSKTFGATGTNTVVLFLEKFDEPPKRMDIILDSVNAIFSNDDISNWEDKNIFDLYLSKIQVSEEEYYKFIKKEEDYLYWDINSYFKDILSAFKNSKQYTDKKKQKSFLKLTEKEQSDWFNFEFYKFASEIEKEKIYYFALIYKQKTLIITAPDNNKEQEQFLGYKWSERKGQEGIQIIKAGGVLYNESNRASTDSLASVIRESFKENEFNIEELNKYYYYLNLKDMINFNGVNFNKAIKTNRIREVRKDPNLYSFKLSDNKVFEVSIGNRVLSDEIEENGTVPVYSANVFEVFGYINKQNITDFSKDSVIWGIDGDWMVNHIPANKPFYPTDHCGVIRIKNDEIIPKYLAYALNEVGKFENFSRTNRASTARIKDLVLQVPKRSVQESIITEFEAIDNKISIAKQKIEQLANDVKSKFVEMFGDLNFIKKPLSDLYILQLGKTPSRSTSSYWGTTENKWISVADMGKYNRFTSYTNEFISNLALQETGIKPVPKNTVIMSFKLTIGRTAITSEDIYTNEAIVAFIDKKTEKLDNDYLRLCLSSLDWSSDQMNAVKGMTLNKNSIGNTLIPIPPIELQNEFADFVNDCDKLKFEEQGKIDSLNNERNTLINKYFH